MKKSEENACLLRYILYFQLSNGQTEFLPSCEAQFHVFQIQMQDAERKLVESKRDGEEADKVDGCRNSLNGKVEREEGELSPSPEADEGLPENLTSTALVVKQEGINHGFNGHIEDEEMECDGKTEGEPDVDEDDEGEESTPKSSDESDNPSVGVEASGSDSANADDSREEHDDDE